MWFSLRVNSRMRAPSLILIWEEGGLPFGIPIMSWSVSDVTPTRRAQSANQILIPPNNSRTSDNMPVCYRLPIPMPDEKKQLLSLTTFDEMKMQEYDELKSRGRFKGSYRPLLSGSFFPRPWRRRLSSLALSRCFLKDKFWARVQYRFVTRARLRSLANRRKKSYQYG